MNDLQSDWQAALTQRHAQQLYRQRRTLLSPQTVRVTVASGQHKAELLNFSSNDYLGLANHPQVVAAAQQALAQYGMGAGASHLVCGHSAEHQALEQELAAFCGRPRALLFSSGYMANSGVLNALLSRRDAIFEDRLNHASLIDGGLLSGARLQRFRHNDMAHLEDCLKRSRAEKKWIAVDGVFSMDGDIAELPALLALAQQYQACLMVDDAHGFACLGAQGRGSAEHWGLDAAQPPLYMATLSKALGCYGAFVAGSETLIETLIQFARNYIYTTALPPCVAAAARAALKLVQTEAWRRQTLQSNIDYFRRRAAALDLSLLPSSTAIQPLLMGDSEQALAVSQKLEEAGFWVVAIRPPTVPAGSARLRITLSAEHTEDMIDALLQALADILSRIPQRQVL